MNYLNSANKANNYKRTNGSNGKSGSAHKTTEKKIRIRKKPRGVRKGEIGTYAEEFLEILNIVFAMQGEEIEHSLLGISYAARERVLHMVSICNFISCYETRENSNVFVFSLKKL